MAFFPHSASVPSTLSRRASPEAVAQMALQNLKAPGFLVLLSRFSVVGLLSTLTYFVVANIGLVVVTLDAAVISLFAYCTGMIVSFLGHKFVTFRVPEKTGRHFVRFLIMSAGGIAISFGGMWLVADILRAPPFWGTLLVAVMVPAFSFVVMKFWVFHDGR